MVISDSVKLPSASLVALLPERDLLLLDPELLSLSLLEPNQESDSLIEGAVSLFSFFE
jgi:hypothetical protein